MTAATVEEVGKSTVCSKPSGRSSKTIRTVEVSAMAVVLGGERGGHRRRDCLDWVEGTEEVGVGVCHPVTVVVFRE